MGWLTRLGIARSDENPQTNPRRRTGFDVAHFIAQNRAASEVEPQVRRGLQEHPRLGFAPRMIATVFADAVQRVIRAVIDTPDRRAFCFKAIAHPSRQVRVAVFVEIAAADAGLVGDDNNRPPQLIGPETSQFENSGNELALVRPMDVTAVHIDDAITVEKKRAAGYVFGRVHPLFLDAPSETFLDCQIPDEARPVWRPAQRPS
jgi:hypothetical protein